MSKKTVYFDSWGSDLEDLCGKNKTKENVVKILERNPLVSTWVMFENYKWLDPILKELEKRGKIQNLSHTVSFPWHKFIIIKWYNSKTHQRIV